jgi:hypothetical protein
MAYLGAVGMLLYGIELGYAVNTVAFVSLPAFSGQFATHGGYVYVA